jgi:osmotically-inducible protein OsmY/sporulation protein YlmC with PRC-barrel domain
MLRVRGSVAEVDSTGETAMTMTDYDFKIGTPVLAAEGKVGRLKYVVVDPNIEVVTHLVVERGLLARHDIVVPVGWVEQADAQGIRLQAKLDELDTLPEFREVEFWAPDPTARPVSGHRPADTRIWISPYGTVHRFHSASILHRVRLGIGEADIVIRRGLPVYSADGARIGTVDHLLVEPPTQRITHLVIHRGRWFSPGEDYMVSIEHVTAASEYGIRLRLRREEISHLPRYHLTTGDAAIQAQVERSLGTQPETRGQGVRVEVERGLVRLLGEVSEAVAQAATQLARWIRGVIGVDDRTTRPGAPGFRIGAPVFALDGHTGHLDKVVIDPHTRRVTHLIIHRGVLLTEDRVVPVELVERATPEGIFLHLTSAEMARQPRYHEERFVSPPPGWEPLPGYAATDVRFWGLPYGGVRPPIQPVAEYTIRHGLPERTIVLERRTAVHTRDDVEGEIDHLLVDPIRQELTHLVVRLNDQPQPSVLVPFEWVEDIGNGSILLKCTRENLRQLQEYTPPCTDDELAAAVTEALQRQGGEALRHVRVEVDRGLVVLHGTAPTVADKARAEQIARSQYGVVAVKNALLASTTITARVAAALAEDPRTALASIDVSSSDGTVTLIGQVPAVEVREAAEQIARAVSGVALVINELEVRPHDLAFDSMVPAWLAMPRGE